MNKLDTKLVTAGRHPEAHGGTVNVPPFRTSTVAHRNLAAFEASKSLRYDSFVYGRFGTPTSFAFEEAIAAIEGGDRAVAVSSGMGACTAAIMACVRSGDHVLLPDSVYLPVRNLAHKMLAPFGVEATFYDPLIGAGIAGLIKPNTRLLYLEAPGSQTFEMPDLPALVAAARQRGILTAMDNTWATPLLFKPLDHGIDLSINAATKYIVGHSDAMLGVVSMKAPLFERVKTTANFFGACPGSEEIFLGLRGLRTMSVRMQRHGENALIVARWLQARPEVHRVLYPALPDDPGHAIWKRDFRGASGLFSVLFKSCSKPALAAFIDSLEYFGIGASFGGYESLVLPFNPAEYRTVTKWQVPGPCVRFHIGLEDPNDLIADLTKAFAHLAAAEAGKKVA